MVKTGLINEASGECSHSDEHVVKQVLVRLQTEQKMVCVIMKMSAKVRGCNWCMVG